MHLRKVGGPIDRKFVINTLTIRLVAASRVVNVITISLPVVSDRFLSLDIKALIPNVDFQSKPASHHCKPVNMQPDSHPAFHWPAHVYSMSRLHSRLCRYSPKTGMNPLPVPKEKKDKNKRKPREMGTRTLFPICLSVLFRDSLARFRWVDSWHC